MINDTLTHTYTSNPLPRITLADMERTAKEVEAIGCKPLGCVFSDNSGIAYLTRKFAPKEQAAALTKVMAFSGVPVKHSATPFLDAWNAFKETGVTQYAIEKNKTYTFNKQTMKNLKNVFSLQFKSYLSLKAI